MDERAALLANVLEHPADDTARLVFADWLEEHSEPEFGRFLRAGVMAARYRGEVVIEDQAYYSALAELAAVAETGFPARWLAAVAACEAETGWGWDSDGDRITVRVETAKGTFARGALAHLALSLDAWRVSAPQAFALWPLERGTITDVPGLAFRIDRADTSWRLTARLRLPPRRVLLGAGVIIPASGAQGAFLIESEGDWRAEELFADRPALLAELGLASKRLVDDLRTEVGDRWPPPPRLRL